MQSASWDAFQMTIMKLLLKPYKFLFYTHYKMLKKSRYYIAGQDNAAIVNLSCLELINILSIVKLRIRNFPWGILMFFILGGLILINYHILNMNPNNNKIYCEFDKMK